MGEAGRGAVRRFIPRRGPSGERDYTGVAPTGATIRLVEGGVNPPRIKLRPVKTPVVRPPAPYNPHLNNTEQQVLQWLAHGKKYDEIAEIMDMTSNAVYQHCHRIYDKLGANTAPGAVAIGFRRGFVK